MATLDEVISQMSEEDYLSDPIQFIIDSDLRIVSVPDRGVVAGVVGDKNVNRINFQMPRYYNGFDMSKFKTRINYVNAKENPNYYTVTDLTIDGDLLIFSWLVDADVVAYVGTVAFSVNMVLTGDDGVIEQAFNTSNVEKLKVLEGIQVDKHISYEEQVDLISKLEADLTKYISSGINQIQDEGAKVKKSLPADYVKMTEDVVSLKEDIGNIKKKKNVVIYVGSAELSDEQKLSCDYVCDGVDDQIEINQAIDSLPDSGGEIHLSRGIFNITNSITIMKRIKITGEGKGITLDRNSVNNGGTTLLSELTGGCIILIQKSDTLSDIKGITLSDFQIVGAGINVENNYCNGINVETYTDCVTLERLAICHCFYGLFVGQSATVDDISVTNCDFQRDATGIYIYGQGWQTRIENNIFWDMSGRSETVGIVLSAGKNIVNGNYFGVSSLLNQGVTCAWISAKNAVSLLCNGNSFSRCTSSPIRFEAGGQFASISGNSFSEIGKAQFQPHERAVLYVDGAGTGGGRISFTNNTVFWANDDDWKTSYLAYLTNQVAQVNISNNTVIDGIGKINEDELVYKSEDSAYAITIGSNVLC